MSDQATAKFRRLAAWSIGPCLPAWAGLGGLALFGRLPWADAFVVGGLIFVVLTLFIVQRLKDFDAVIVYAETLLSNPEAPPPVLTHSATAVRLLTAMTALQRLWTDRRDQAETTARSQQNIIDALPDPLLLLDGRRRVRSANAAARELFNLGPSGLQEPAVPVPGGRAVADRDLAGLIRDPKVLEAVDTTLNHRHSTEAQFVLPTPVQRTFQALVVPLPEPVEDSAAVIVALSDQTERLKVERMRADFVANASHELRTPLAAVLGFIETLRGPAKDDEKARIEFLEIMFKQASRMARLIDDLLSLSRIELREHARPADAVDIANVLRTTVELLQAEAARRRTRITVAVPDDLPPALGDHGELGQVFANLLANAIKYGGDEGRVDITAEVSTDRPFTMPGEGPCLKVAVKDHGEGIALEHIPRLTERFYRVDTARSRSLGGTGLGLAIVKHIANRHRGTLTVESVEGMGATFTIWLPMVPSDKRS